MPEGCYTNIRCRNCGSHYVDSEVTEDYLDELQATHIPQNENRTTYAPTEDRDEVRTAELAENWQMITKVRAPRQGERLLDYGSAWGAFGNVARQSGVVPNGSRSNPKNLKYVIVALPYRCSRALIACNPMPRDRQSITSRSVASSPSSKSR